MKHTKLYTSLGIAGALLVPALAMGAIDIPNVFTGGDPVSASQMNENFEAMADAIDDLEARLGALETAGLPGPVGLATFHDPVADLRAVYRASTDGVLYVRASGNGLTGVTAVLDVGTDVDAATQSVSCDEEDTCNLARGRDGSSASVVVPAGKYVAVEVDALPDSAYLRVFWQPLRPGASEPPELIATNGS